MIEKTEKGNPSVSVIVPVYNAGTTLISCLGNLLGQTLSDLEIILVDDASTDNSKKIMKDAETQFPAKVRVITFPENRGPGAARNAGIEIARGDYIGFVDADDIADVSMYEKLYRRAEETGADLTDCAYYRESLDRALILVTEELAGEITPEKRSMLVSSGGYMVTKLYKRSLFAEYGIRFREEYGLEDLDFQIRLLMKAKTVAAVPEVLYLYRDADDEASLTRVQDPDKYRRIRKGAFEGVFEAVKDEAAYLDVKEAAEYLMFDMYRNLLILSLRKGTGYSREQAIAQLEEAKALRRKCITGKPSENPFVKQFFDARDIRLMEENDRDPAAVYRKYYGAYDK